MNTALRSHVAAAMLLLPLSAALVAEPAVAQQRAVVAQAAISALVLNSDAGLAPGATLRLQVLATPGARNASVAMGNGGIRVALREQNRGNFTGSYTIKRGDRIDPLQVMTVRATYGERQLVQGFTYPPAFQAMASGPSAAHGSPSARPPVAQPPVAQAPVIEDFRVQPRGRIAPGRVLNFRVAGAAGGNAWVDIPGVAERIPLRQTRPGFYEGSYTVRRADRLEAFDTAVATLRSGGERTTAQVEFRQRDEDGRPGQGGDRPGQRDERPPQVSELNPAMGERVDERRRTHISARIADDRSGVDPASVRLRVDGLDVTANIRMEDGKVHYREALGRGRHDAELVVADKAGNTARTSWSFEVF